MDMPNGRAVTFYVPDELLERIESKRSELARSGMRIKPSRSALVVGLLEKALGE